MQVSCVSARARRITLLTNIRGENHRPLSCYFSQSHECAHMWFGNIATLNWWDNLWLNEVSMFAFLEKSSARSDPIAVGIANRLSPRSWAKL